MSNEEPIRLNRYLAQCGLGARRKCDELISSGHILINGVKVTELGTKVVPGDRVEYKGRALEPVRKLEYFAYYKPAGVMVTRTDPEGRPTIYDDLRERGFEADHLNYTGRLDCNSEGLLLLTNDGSLIHALTHPRYKIKKIYKVLLDRALDDADIAKMIRGIESEEQLLHAGEVRKLAEAAFCYEVDLYEGKNRQIRRMFDSLDHKIRKLIRVHFASVKLGDLPPGSVRALTEREVAALKRAGFPDKPAPGRPR